MVATVACYLGLALNPEWFRLLGVGHLFGWFFDSYAILAANDLAAAGGDAFGPNPLDPLGRPHVYSHWWLGLSALGLTRAHNFILGGFFVAAFFTAVFAWLRPRGAGEAGWYMAILLAGPVVLGVERANNDLLMLALMMPVAPLLAAERGWVRWCALVPVALAAGLKFYPAAGALVLLAGASRKEVWARGVAAGALLLVVGLDVRGDLALMGDFVPHPGGLMTFGAGQVFEYFGAEKAAAKAWGLLAGAMLLAMLRPWRWFAGWVVAPEDRALWWGFVLGAVLLTGCFFAGSSYGYRLIYCVLMAPFLWRLVRRGAAPAGVVRLARMTAGLMFFMLWGDAVTTAVLNAMITPESSAAILAVAEGVAIWGEPLTWAFFICLGCFVAGFAREVCGVVFGCRAGGGEGGAR